MSRLRTYLTAVVVAVMAATGLSPRGLMAQSDAKTDLTGKWAFTVTTDAGTGTPTVTFTQKGDSLSGHYSSQMLGEAPLNGTIKDGKFTFIVHVDVQGTALEVTYKATVESKDALKGSIDLGGQGTGTFTGKRQ